MALSPQRIRDTAFKSARRGYDQGEVDSFVSEVATALETAQNDATAMEARARAAVARLQELSHQAPADQVSELHPSVDEAETISRTLLLAQRTADTTVVEAQAEADRVIAAARDEATASLDNARQETERLIEQAQADARRAGESERVQVEGEVQALLARRDFLESDVDHLEQYLVAQRERIAEAVAELNDLVQRVPNGLADMRRPLLSAAAEPSAASEEEAADGVGDVGAVGDDDGDDPFAVEDSRAEERSEIAEITKVAQAEPHDDTRADIDSDGSRRDSTPASPARALFGDDGEPTRQLGVTERDET